MQQPTGGNSCRLLLAGICAPPPLLHTPLNTLLSYREGLVLFKPRAAAGDWFPTGSLCSSRGLECTTLAATGSLRLVRSLGPQQAQGWSAKGPQAGPALHRARIACLTTSNLTASSWLPPVSLPLHSSPVAPGTRMACLSSSVSSRRTLAASLSASQPV